MTEAARTLALPIDDEAVVSLADIISDHIEKNPGWDELSIAQTILLTHTRAHPAGTQDRDALIHTICPHIRQWSDGEEVTDFCCQQCPPTVQTSHGEGVQMCRLNAEKCADAILALPPAPIPERDEVERRADNNTLHGMIAAIYSGLDAEDCAYVDYQWRKFREEPRANAPLVIDPADLESQP